MAGLRVLVVGASIAGPTAAFWLARAGARVTVVERFPSLREGGQNVDIRTTGVTVMGKMPGMEAAVRAKSTEMDGIQLVNNDGTPFASMGATGNTEQQSFVSEFEIFRGHLARILYDMTKDNERIQYLFGEQVASIRESEADGPVNVDFQNGHPASEFDLVVACDGATSRTRAVGLGCGVRDHIQSLQCWNAYFSIKGDLLEGSKTAVGWNAPGGRFIGIGPDPFSPVTRVTLMRIHSRNESNAAQPFREASQKGEEALKKYVAEQFHDCGYKTDTIIAGMLESPDFYASELVQVKVPQLSKGRFVLVGDAGYATGPTGTGTSLAIGGAYVLAGEIASHPQDVPKALQAYEERMKPIIADMQQIPYGFPYIMAPQSARMLWIRNTFLAVATRLTFLGPVFSWLGSWFAASLGGDKYNLPEYPWKY